MPLPNKLPEDFIKKSTNESFQIGNRYSIVKRIGSGNFGTAFLIDDSLAVKENEKKKVLKQICVGPVDPGETVDAMQEARLLSQLKHKNIVQFHSSFLDGQFFCIVLEYCEGGDLECKLREYKDKNESVPEEQVTKWLKQLLRAISYMHDRRILHRDLKSRNIFLKDNQVKIGDFGISRILIGTTDKASTFVGTPYYMSPEVLNHEDYDEKCDIWSLGCVLYEICCFDHAFNGTSLMGVMMKIVSQYTPQLPDSYSRGLNNILQSMLSRDVSKRQTAKVILIHPLLKRVETIPRNAEKFLTAREKLRMRKQKEADLKMQHLRELSKMKQIENERIRKQSQERNFSRSSFDINMAVQDTINSKQVARPPIIPMEELREDNFPEPLNETLINKKQQDAITLKNHVTISQRTLLPPEAKEVPVDANKLNISDELLLSLIENGHIPEEEDLADTLYSLNDEFESSSDDDDLPDDYVEMSDSEYRDMFEMMEDALHLDASVLSRESGPSGSMAEKRPVAGNPSLLRAMVASSIPPQKHQTISGPFVRERPAVEQNRPATSATNSERPLSNFAENMMDQRIGNMRRKCVEALGEDLFARAYAVAKQLRFDDFSQNTITREELNRIVADGGKCLDLEQLIYLESERKVT